MSKKVLISIIAVVLLIGAGAVFFKKNTEVGLPSNLPETEYTETTEQTPISESLTTTATPNQITLTITSHINGSVVSTPAITISGKTSPRAEVFVNDSETIADAQGNFSVRLTLDEGENPVIVVANDAVGNSAEQELIITYNS